MDESNWSITPLGDSAILISFGHSINEYTNTKVLAAFAKIREQAINGILDVIPAYCSLTICYDPLLVTNCLPFKFYSDKLTPVLRSLEDRVTPKGRSIQVPVCYSTGYGLDLEKIAEIKKMDMEEIVQIHCSKSYRVYMLGFLPGFAYMGEVNEHLAMPRLAQPRPLIEAGSVGIANTQTGIYPLDSPGGWQIIGKTPLQIFNKHQDDPTFFRPGDEVQFYSISAHEFAHY